VTLRIALRGICPLLAGLGLSLTPAALAEVTPPAGTGQTTGGTSAPTGVLPTATVTLPATTLDPPLLVTSGPVSIGVHPTALLGVVTAFTGSASPKAAGRTVAILRVDIARAAWKRVAKTRVTQDGDFVAHWRASVLGQITVRATILPSRAASSAGARRSTITTSALSSSSEQLTVYRPALASFFGPGFYGKQTACGEQMSQALVGVASRTLPCGTLVQVDYRGQHLTVPVVDRGPYANGADWDLTAAAAEALHLTETVRIGTMIVGALPPGSLVASAPTSTTSTTGVTGPSADPQAGGTQAG
jgi:rare lipoprotein A